MKPKSVPTVATVAVWGLLHGIAGLDQAGLFGERKPGGGGVDFGLDAFPEGDGAPLSDPSGRSMPTASGLLPPGAVALGGGLDVETAVTVPVGGRVFSSGAQAPYRNPLPKNSHCSIGCYSWSYSGTHKG